MTIVADPLAEIARFEKLAETAYEAMYDALPRMVKSHYEDAMLYLAKALTEAERAGNVTAAERLIDNITNRFWLLGEYPEAGRPTEAAGTRCFPAGKYLIYYRITRRGTDILHIFHGARDQRETLRAK